MSDIVTVGSLYSHINEHSVVWSCPDCDGPIAASFIVPTEDMKARLVGRCPNCFKEHGDKRTSYATLSDFDYDEWRALMSVPNLPVARSK